MTLVAKWTPDHIRLAQQHDALWLKFNQRNGCRTLVDVQASETEGYIQCEVVRGRLCVPLDHVYMWVHVQGDFYGAHPDAEAVDGIPWEIHAIEDEAAWTDARDAYLACSESFDV